MTNFWLFGAVLFACGGAFLAEAQAPAALKPFVKEDAPELVLEHLRVIDGTGAAAIDDSPPRRLTVGAKWRT